MVVRYGRLNSVVDGENAGIELNQSHHCSLQIAKGVNAIEIKKAYRKLAVVHHPDKGKFLIVGSMSLPTLERGASGCG